MGVADMMRGSKIASQRLHAQRGEPQVVAVAVEITNYIALSRFDDALGVRPDSMFVAVVPRLEGRHRPSIVVAIEPHENFRMIVSPSPIGTSDRS